MSSGIIYELGEIICSKLITEQSINIHVDNKVNFIRPSVPGLLPVCPSPYDERTTEDKLLETIEVLQSKEVKAMTIRTQTRAIKYRVVSWTITYLTFHKVLSYCQLESTEIQHM